MNRRTCPKCGAVVGDHHTLMCKIREETGEERFVEHIGPHEDAMQSVLAEAAALHLRKHHDYTGKPILRSGQQGIRIRLYEQLDRLENLKESTPAVAENRRDTWMDILVYAMIAVMLEDGTFQLPASWEAQP